MLYEIPEESPKEFSSPKMPLTAMMKTVALENREVLTEEEAKAVLLHCNIPVLKTGIARTSEEAAFLASQMGYPVVIKILSPQIIHKTDAGGVVLDINNKRELEETFNLIMERAKQYLPNADIVGVTVQPMIKKSGYELIVGAKKDSLFGPVILFGMGGIGVEIFKDVAIGLPPLNRVLAKRLIGETRVYEILRGYRNKPPANLELLEEILMRFSQMLVDFPQIKEVDINPLFIDEKEAFALDARIVIDKDKVFTRTKPYEHLVISPYPTKYEDYFRLPDNQEVFLRPIRPEDEKLLLEMFQNLAEETENYNFLAKTKGTLHEIMASYCNIDYEREMVIVAETSQAGQREFIGAARLITERDGKTGEITFVITRFRQDRGLTTKLVDNILRICSDKNLETVHTRIPLDNHKTIEIMKKKSFSFEETIDNTMRAFLRLKS
jgi:acetyltransferase